MSSYEIELYLNHLESLEEDVSLAEKRLEDVRAGSKTTPLGELMEQYGLEG